MRVLNLLSFIFFLSIFNSCGLFSEEEKEDDDSTQVFTGDSSLECSDSSRCVEICKKLFSAESVLLSKCRKTNSAEIAQINIIYSSMGKGNWDSIKTEHLKVLIDFDDDIWPKYARVNNRVSAREMLLWVAEEEDVATLLDDKQVVLKNAFTIMGAPAYEEEVVFEGMKKDVDIERNQTFFEVSALNKNDRAFQAAHELLKEECEEQKNCVKTVYCDIYQSVVFGKLNELELGADADVDGQSLYADECD